MTILDVFGSLAAYLSDPITLCEATNLGLLHPNENENDEQRRIILTSDPW